MTENACEDEAAALSVRGNRDGCLRSYTKVGRELGEAEVQARRSDRTVWQCFHCRCVGASKTSPKMQPGLEPKSFTWDTSSIRSCNSIFGSCGDSAVPKYVGKAQNMYDAYVDVRLILEQRDL